MKKEEKTKMTILDLEKVLKENYLVGLSQKISNYGSEYVRVRGITFRLSDHFSKWTHSSHIDVSCYEDILEYLLESNLIKKVEVKYEDFLKLYMDGGCYENHEITEVEMKNSEDSRIVFDNGIGIHPTKERAIKGLYYGLFKEEA